MKFQSEHKERIYRTASLRDHFEVDSVDLLVQDEKNQSNLPEQSTPVGKIKQLTTFGCDLLHDYHKQHLLSWHDGGIPQIEIWLKLDGDHGGGSFKFCLLNVKHPNSKTSTFLVRMFEAKDNVENLKRVLGSDEFN